MVVNRKERESTYSKKDHRDVFFEEHHYSFKKLKMSFIFQPCGNVSTKVLLNYTYSTETGGSFNEEEDWANPAKLKEVACFSLKVQ